MADKVIIGAPFVVGGREIETVTGDQAIRARLEQLLGTSVGEIPWRPDYGLRVDAWRGLPLATLQGLARADVIAAVERWMPEVGVRQVIVNVVDSEGPGAAVELVIVYFSRATGRPGQARVVT